MIDKKGGDFFHKGGGRPFEEHEYQSPGKDDAERQKHVVIDLGDLEHPGKGGVNFVRKAGRTLDSFGKYWTEHDEEAEFDIK